ncbi:hypothetical protein CTEN210_00803 [Chaetoceros tenuissimus]|uniref:Uncharacterized protein n=1 Tax=Chaetoceros tenuissimus TaxID=426638 RepID=A0AAD3GZH4_9STRA|nr:hypothetical protein CTEN210_00803 [Chaetoceros tenuissimus]
MSHGLDTRRYGILKPFTWRISVANDNVFDTYIDDDRRDVHKMMLNKYDLDGDGKLDTSEQQNIGHDILRMRDVANMQKKLLIAASSFIVLLTIANIGSAYCAMILAKDLKVSSNGVMKDMTGGNVKTEGIAPKVILYEVSKGGRCLKSKRDIHRNLQNGQESDGTYFSIQGFVDVQGVSDILDGGLTQFLTDSGMQSCDVTGFQKQRSETLYILFTSCGRGRLVLQQDSQQGTQGMCRKLISDLSQTNGAFVAISNVFGDDPYYWNDRNVCQGGVSINESVLFYSTSSPMSFWIWMANLTLTLTDEPSSSPPVPAPSTLSPSPSISFAPTESYPSAFQSPVPAPTTPAPTETVQCVGINYSGQLGTKNKINAATPVDMKLPDDPNTTMTPIQVVTGFEHTCVLFKEDGSVYCVGRNNYRQLGNDSNSDSNELVQVQCTDDGNTLAPLSGVKKIAAGFYHNCAIFQNDSLYCWGISHANELDFNNHNGVKLMALSNGRTCIVTNNNTVKCTDRFSGTLTINFGNGAVITKLTAGNDHFCALLLADRTAKCFGRNTYGQLGNGLKTDATTDPFDTEPKSVVVRSQDGTTTTTLQNISDINAGESSTCLVLMEGETKCFGENNYNQLGMENSRDSFYHVMLNPTTPPPLQTILNGDKQDVSVVSVHVAQHTGHAVLNDNTVVAWGSNNVGILGGTDVNGNQLPTDTVINGNTPAVQMEFNFA